MIGTVDIPPTSVLVIESHPMMREALCNAIAAEAGLQVIYPADSNAEVTQVIALEPDAILLTHKPDIVLLALGNPGSPELEALKALHTTFPETPILALTSNEVPGQEQAALAAGARAVLTKAASRAELIGVIRELRTKAIFQLQWVRR